MTKKKKKDDTGKTYRSSRFGSERKKTAENKKSISKFLNDIYNKINLKENKNIEQLFTKLNTLTEKLINEGKLKDIISKTVLEIIDEKNIFYSINYNFSNYDIIPSGNVININKINNKNCHESKTIYEFIEQTKKKFEFIEQKNAMLFRPKTL